jgi:tetratricopeptide (TPR) repeat protein
MQNELICLLIERYRFALSKLDQDSTNSDDVFCLLKLREEIYCKISSLNNYPSLDLEIIRLDRLLRKKSKIIIKKGHLRAWRDSLNPPEHYWWWFLDVSSSYRSFSWMWSIINGIVLITDVSLTIDIIQRFIGSDPNTLATLFVCVQGLLTVIVGESIITKGGEEILVKILNSFGYSKYYINLFRFICASCLLIFLLFSGFFVIPKISIYYNNLGVDDYESGKLINAQNNFNRAIKIKSDYAEAHYNLGRLFDIKMNDPSRAHIEYQLAMQGGLNKAYSSMSRIYILEKKYSEAIAVIYGGFKLHEDNKNTQVKENDEIQHELLMNFGWAELKRKNYFNAIAKLEDSLELKLTDEKKAKAHCILGSVYKLSLLESKAKNVSATKIKAKDNFTKCLGLFEINNNNNLDVIKWRSIASACLENSNGEKKCLDSLLEI